LNYIDRPSGSLIDRTVVEPELEQIDVIMATLDAASFLEKGLYSVYREIPVRKLYVCDGGSKDKTLEILKKFPRVTVFIKPEINTGGKILEFLFSLSETKWFAIVDSDIELYPGWYDEMRKNRESDVLESSNRIKAYHLYREDREKLREESRSGDFCHLIRKEAVQDYHSDDDFMWRYTDIFFRQVVEKSGYRYSKVNTAKHVHNETERVPYESDEEKNFRKMVWNEPKWVIIDKKKADIQNLKNAKAIIKYLDPDFHIVKKIKWLDGIIKNVDRKWVMKNGPKWLARYERGSSITFSLKTYI